MSYGDRLMAIGDAWKQYSADQQKRKVAIGDGKVIDQSHADLLWGLDFLAEPKDLIAGEQVSWVLSYPHHRPYIDYSTMKRQLGFKRHLQFFGFGLTRLLGHYCYDLGYRPTPAPIRLKPEELSLSQQWAEQPFVLLEPHIKMGAPPSKQWPVERFAQVAAILSKEIPVYQISAPGSVALPGLPQIRPRSFRESLAYLQAARLYIGPEGGLHHGAAAMGTKAVVIYGGFTSPLITGYDIHVKLTGGATYACGTRRGMCPHCARHLDRIAVSEVLDNARQLLGLS